MAGSPQPFAPAPEEPSVITRMPHVINYRYEMYIRLYNLYIKYLEFAGEKRLNN